MKQCILLLFILVVPAQVESSSWWPHSRAAAYGQDGKWQEAQAELTKVIVDNPDQADVLYDNGIAAYRLGQYATAAAYFESVIQEAVVPLELKKQALFNLGNTNVALKELPAAIKKYEEVLALEPDNQAAAHNLAKVKEMLKQQQQQNQNQKPPDNQQGNDQQQNKEANKDRNDSDKESSQQDQPTQSPNESAKDGLSEKSRSKPSSAAGNQEKKERANDKKQGQEERESQDKSGNNDDQQKQEQLRDSHASSPSHAKRQPQGQKSSPSNAQTINNEDKEQGIQKGTLEDTQKDGRELSEQQFGAHERWMARMLAHQEKADKMAQKALIKTNIDKQLAGHNGQNCW